MREKSKMLAVKKSRNLATETVQIFYQELQRVGDDFLSELFMNLRPEKFGITAQIRPGMIDTIKANMLSQWASNGACLSEIGYYNAAKRLKKLALKGIYVGAVLADCLGDVSGEDKDLYSILDDIKYWIRARVRRIAALKYVPRDPFYKNAGRSVKKARKVCFSGGLESYSIGPAFLSFSSNFVTIAVAGRPYLSRETFAGVSCNMEFSEGYSIKQAMSELKSIAQFKELSEAVSRRASELRSKGKVREAAQMQQRLVSWAYSLQDAKSFAEKLQLLLALLTGK